ncbi:MAG: hypothetical protein KC505_01535 [Myxococcales bacterium]|nr:hypothetical protein [Myxococcales bacterium]USN51774.1 MAG: hypothetical protein H6731_05035 [Myxococcales bacterium]
MLCKKINALKYVWLCLILVFSFSSYGWAKCKDLPKISSTPLFREHEISYNERYVFLVHKGDICIKRKNSKARWHKLKTLSEMKEQVEEISVDGSRLVAKTKNGQIYFMKRAHKKTDKFIWTARWGVPLGFGSGLSLADDIKTWDFSFLSPKADKSYVDSAKVKHTVGLGVSTIYAVRGDQQTINYYDPWLPSDDSYGLCGPFRGQLVIQSLSASGSTVVVMDKYGNIFILRSDFDMAGGDRFFFGYTYEIEQAKGGLIPWLISPRKLPVPDWVQLPKINGVITDRISIDREGEGAQVRVVRVEGMKDGQSGYYETKYDFIANSPVFRDEPEFIEWKFIKTDMPLLGNKIDAGALDNDKVDLGSNKNQDYGVVIFKEDSKPISFKLIDFNSFCGSAFLKIRFFNPDETMELFLHSTEQFRFVKNKKTLKKYATIEIPKELLDNFDSLSRRKQKFIKRHLNQGRFTSIELEVKKNVIVLDGFKNLKRLELGGLDSVY